VIRELAPSLHRWIEDADEQEHQDWTAWKPFPGPQTYATASLADEIFYGGAAGGGKTGLLVGLALTQHRRSTIFRRTFPELDEIVEQIQAIGGPTVRVAENKGRAVTDDGRKIKLGYMLHEKDKEKYRGRPNDFIGIDEAPTFSQSQVEFVTGWNRTTFRDQRLRIILTGNPPTTQEGLWIIDAFAPWLLEGYRDPAAPGELRWYSMVDGELKWFKTGEPFEHRDKYTGRQETIIPKSRTFFPAGLKDNPLFADGRYQATIQGKPEPLRSQMLYGDFSIGLMDDAWQVIPTAWIRAAQARWVANGGDDEPICAAGVDTAYGGSDRSVFVQRRGGWFSEPTIWKGAETDSGEKVADLIAPKMGSSRAPVNMDIIGYGAAAFEFSRKKGLNVIGINFGASGSGMTDKRQVLSFMNVRAYAYWQLRDALDPDVGGGMIALPPGRDVLVELASARYEVVGGKLKLEPKEDIAERLGRSPDVADAIVLANYMPGGVGFFFKVLETR